MVRKRGKKWKRKKKKEWEEKKWNGVVDVQKRLDTLQREANLERNGDAAVPGCAWTC